MCLLTINNLPISINIKIYVPSGNFLKILGFYFFLHLATEYHLVNNFFFSRAWPRMRMIDSGILKRCRKYT